MKKYARSAHPVAQKSLARSSSQSFKILTLSHLIAAVCASGALSAVAADESTEKANEIVVTGTLIRGTVPVGTPVMKLDRATIENSGAATTGDLLRQLPQIQNLGADEGHLNTAQNANQNITVGSGVNLRGLGPESTLTLVNGRRLSPGGLGAQYTDPSTIPPLAIERVEVITDGGSATYGSDAVGGVVNIRLRKNYNGAEVSLMRGAGDSTDQNQIGAIVGKSWETGNAMIALDQNKRGRLNADDRGFYTDDMRAWGGPDLRGFNASPGNIQIGSTRYAIPAGQNGVGLTASKLVAGSPNMQSIYKGVDALPEQNRRSILGSFSQSLGDAATLTIEAFSTDRTYNRRTAAQSSNATVRSTNPFFVSPVAGVTSETVNYSYINDWGVSVGTGFERSRRVSAALDFDLAGNWSGSAFIARSQTQSNSTSMNINANAVNAALADTNPATALNLFCDASKFQCNNPATLDKIRAFNDRNATYILNDGGVKFDGPLFALPAGKVRLAVGAGVHHDEMPYYENRNNSTPTTATIFHIDNAKALPQRTVKSLYVEGFIPLVGASNAMPGVERLDLSLAARGEQYSDFGSTNNPKAGLDWTPTQGVKLHTTYGTSFRAPTLGDIDPINAGVINVVDRVGADGKTLVHGIQLLGGREGLTPETADITTFGFNFKPSSKGIDVTVDYFNVNYKNRILTPGNDATILQKPELAAYLTMNPSASQVAGLIAYPTYSGASTEPVAGIKFIADGRRYNAGIVKTSGIDLSVRYTWDNSAGAWNAGLYGNYIINYQQQFTPTTALVDGLLNTLNNPMRFRGRAEIGLSNADWRANVFYNFTNGYKNTTLATMPTVSAFSTIDLTAQYALGKQLGASSLKELRASFNVRNLFGRNPPYVQNGTLAFDPQNVSAIGRFLSLGLSYKY